MKVTIVYFSGSGNTKFLSQKLLEEFKKSESIDVETIPVELAQKNICNFSAEGTILGIGYPVYDLMPPPSVLEFVEQLESVKTPRKTFVFSTYTTNPLDSNYFIIEQLQQKGYCVAAQDNFKAPGASSFLYANPHYPIVRGKSVFKAGINLQLEDFVNQVMSADYENVIPIKYDRFHDIHAKLSIQTFGNLFYRKLECNSNCSNCGKCVKSCPTSNLALENGKLVIKDPNGCLHCLRCVVGCNQNAINFTSSKRRGCYPPETIEKAYKKSCI